MEKDLQRLVQTTTWSSVGPFPRTRTSIKRLGFLLTTENQIDHICISQRFRHSLLDVRVRRGADAGSDHHLVAARIQLKLKRMKPRQGRVKSSVQQFQDIGTSELYQVPLHNWFQALQLLQQQEAETPRSLEDTWEGLKSIWKETCEEET